MKTIRIHFIDFLKYHTRIPEMVVQLLEQKYNVILDQENPGFLFCLLQNIRTSSLGDHRLYDDRCCKIALTGENVIPDLNIYDYGLGSAYIEHKERYIRCPLQYTHMIPEMLENWRVMSLQDARKQHRFCNFIQSNGKAAKNREQFFHLLSQYKHIHSAGKFLRNTDELHEMESQLDTERKPWLGGEAKERFMKKFKFSITFENHSYPGYTTEKILKAFLSRTIPIYWGNPRVAEDFVPGSFINAHDFDDLQALVEEVKRIDNDDDAYMEMLNTHPIPEKYQSKGSWQNKMQSFFLSIVDQDIQAARRVPSFPPRRWWKRKKILSLMNPIQMPKADFNTPKS